MNGLCVVVAVLAWAAGPTALPGLASSCTAGKAEACTKLARVYLGGEGVPRSLGRAARLYDRGCNGGDVEACHELGLLWATGEGVVAADEERARQLFSVACDRKHAPSCWMLAMAMAFAGGDDPSESTKPVLDLIRKACEGGEAEACEGMATTHGEGGQGVPKDPIEARNAWLRALDLRVRACDAGDAEGCVTAAGMYGSPESGLEAEKRPPGYVDPARARDYRRRAEALLQGACDRGDLGHTGCVGLGMLYTSGEAPEFDFERAFAALAKACRARFYQGCEGLHRMEIPAGGAGTRSGEAKNARIREACVVREACGWPSRPPAGPEDQPLGDSPGSTEVRDRLVARAFDKEAPLDDRFDAAESVARMGLPQLVAPLLERQKVHETHDDMLLIRLEAENDESALLGKGRSPSREEVEALAHAALDGARNSNDAWGRPLRVQVYAKDPKYFPWGVHVLSDGPDGRPGTEDDLSTAEPTWVYDRRRYPTLDFTEAEEAARSVPHLEARCRNVEVGADACRDLARMFVAGTGVPKDPARAVELYARACEGFAEACDEVGLLLATGDRLPKDAERASRFFAQARTRFEKTCFPDIKTRDACLRLGSMYERGEGGPPDPKRALLIYGEFCNQWGKVPEACQALDRLSPKGVPARRRDP
jgi:TPR repeat protein